MKRKYCGFLILFLASWIALCALPVQAQPDRILLDHAKEFGKKSRPAVSFPHLRHIEAGRSCKDCHHLYENGKNVLDESKLEAGSQGVRCSACHSSGSRIGLEQAFHKQCLGCHKQLHNEKKKTGPQLCGECHQRRK